MDIIKYIQSFSNPFFDIFFSIITHLGGQTIGIIISILFFLCINKKFGYKFLYAMLFSFCLNNIIKGFFNSPRPIGVEGIHSSEISTATGSSFPSGHSQGNATAFTFLMSEFKNKKLWFIGIFMIIMVPLSRLYLGVHWPVDVIFGTIFGILSVFISNKIFDSSYKEPYKLIILSLLIFLTLGFILPSLDLVKALGSFSGLILSLIIENRYINFEPKGSLSQHIIKILIALIGALLFYIIFSLFKTSLYIQFFKYFFMITWALLISPFLFVRLKLCKTNI